MRQPSLKLIMFFIVALLAGYAVSFALMALILQAPLYQYGFVNLTVVALLVAILLTVWLDKPLDLGLFKWPAPKPKVEKKPVAPVQPAESASPDMTPQPQLLRGGLFPYEVPSEHWTVDFSDGEQVYQGADLPIWILAGWAVFIIWAVIYLFSGLETLPF
jgi:hypothetical protein